jgi:hypothetical protein
MSRFILLTGLFLAATPLQAQTASTCRAADANSQRLLSYIRELVSSTDTTRVKIRTALKLPAMDSTRVTLVTDNKKCASVAQGINAATGKTGLIRQLYVISVGTYYAAQDPGHPSGEWWPTVSLDKQYHALGVVLAP